MLPRKRRAQIPISQSNRGTFAGKKVILSDGYLSILKMTACLSNWIMNFTGVELPEKLVLSVPLHKWKHQASFNKLSF